jgi:hypothetical protein
MILVAVQHAQLCKSAGLATHRHNLRKSHPTGLGQAGHAGGIHPLRIRETHDYRRFPNTGNSLALALDVKTEIKSRVRVISPGGETTAAAKSAVSQK